MQKNHIVQLRSARGVIERIVVEDFGDVITVSTKEEIELAEREGRAPFVAGFRKTDVLKTLNMPTD